MTSPWPKAEAQRNAILKRHDTGRIFSYESCRVCDRWFPSEREENAMAPLECPVCDEVSKAERKARAANMRKAVAR